MTRFLRVHAATIAVAMATAIVTAAGPALAAAVAEAINADTVDGKHAVGAGASVSSRAGKLVATNGNGTLPNNIIVKAPDSSRLGGLAPTAFLRRTAKAADSDKLDGKDSTSFVQADTVVTRSFSCSGTNFWPIDGETGYQTVGSLRYLTSGGGQVRCNVVLPDGAVLTAFSCSVRDTDIGAVDRVGCQLVRNAMVSGMDTEQVMAATEDTVGTPGDVRQSTTSFSHNPINNATHSYSLLANIFGGTAGTGIYGATLTYQIQAGGGAGTP